MSELKNKYFEMIELIITDLEKYVIFITRNREIAKDVLSDAILKGFNSFQSIKNISSFKYYMLTIIRRTFYEYKRKSNYYDESYKTIIDSIYSDELSPEDKTDVAILYDALDKLNESDRELIILAELSEMPHKEIADMLGTNSDNIKTKVYRAKKKLKEILNDLELQWCKNERH